MEFTLEKLWTEYFAEECSAIDSDEERELVKKAAEMRKIINDLLTKEQNDAVEKYIEALYEMQGHFVKKGFFKGCEYTTSFFFAVKLY